MSFLYKLFKIGYNEQGFNKYGFDSNGYNKDGFDAKGYDKDGFDSNGYSKSGFNAKGYDEDGFDNNGYNKDGFDAKGYDKDGFNIDKHFYINAFNNYEDDNLNENNIINLFNCYLNGTGIHKNFKKAFELLVEGAFKNSKICLMLLSDFFNNGKYVEKNESLAQYIYSLAIGKDFSNINQYQAMTPTTFIGKNKHDPITLNEESNHLKNVISYINNNINEIKSKFIQLESNTRGMNNDQRDDWVIQKNSNSKKLKEISDLEDIKARPYYARMDATYLQNIESHYIGEVAYPSNNIVSVWSEYGRKYRAMNEKEFVINSHKYTVTLRRRFDIKTGEIHSIFDDFSINSNNTESQVTDPYLLKILEEKKGESNISNIIRSIQLNQNEIIEYSFNKSLIVQGCAGSGKTMLLLHRLANMKYNNRNLNIDKIKIITPNTQFILFIDELSKNLNIEQIEKLTLDDYFILLLSRYRYENQELYQKKIIRRSIELLEDAWRETGPTKNDEYLKLSLDNDFEYNIISKIYSYEFIKALTEEGISLKNNHDKKKDYGSVIYSFVNIFNSVLTKFGNNIKISKNYSFVLFCKLVFIYAYYGKLNETDNLLCIDEGQDISKHQYLLLKNINGNNTVFNIYGDINQQIPNSNGIKEWYDLQKFFESKYFSLNENYRNSDEIIKFYNDKLKINNTSFGLKTKPVQEIQFDDLLTNLRLQLLLKNRTALIINDKSIISNQVKELCTSEVTLINKVALLNVRQAKGLEFDTVFVYDIPMTKNEKYIAYSRALSELYIIK